ncbi:MAG: VOC family protein, partial [Cyanobacteria bacterium J06621_15]
MFIPLNHVGVTVTDLDKVIQWYGEVLGFELLMGPLEIKASNPTIGTICKDIFGERWESMRQAHMSMGNGIGLEVFEFVEPKAEPRENNFLTTKINQNHGKSKRKNSFFKVSFALS